MNSNLPNTLLPDLLSLLTWTKAAEEAELKLLEAGCHRWQTPLRISNHRGFAHMARRFAKSIPYEKSWCLQLTLFYVVQLSTTTYVRIKAFYQGLHTRGTAHLKVCLYSTSENSEDVTTTVC